MESSAVPPGTVPWRWVAVDPDGRYSGERWARPSASAQEIADELMAVIAFRLLRKHDDKRTVRALLEMCVVQVTRPAMQGWPAEYGEAHGITWLDEPTAEGAPGQAA